MELTEEEYNEALEIVRKGRDIFQNKNPMQTRPSPKTTQDLSDEDLEKKILDTERLKEQKVLAAKQQLEAKRIMAERKSKKNNKRAALDRIVYDKALKSMTDIDKFRSNSKHDVIICVIAVDNEAANGLNAEITAETIKETIANEVAERGHKRLAIVSAASYKEVSTLDVSGTRAAQSFFLSAFKQVGNFIEKHNRRVNSWIFKKYAYSIYDPKSYRPLIESKLNETDLD